MSPFPSYACGLVVLVYWGTVLRKIIRAGRKNRGASVGALPRSAVERLLWSAWVPTIIAWMALPFVIPQQTPGKHFWLDPVIAGSPAVSVVRWAAVVGAALVYFASVRCWRHMGRHWRIAIDAGQTTLLTDGPFSRVRHPIYSLNILLALLTAIAVPAPAVFAVTAAHVLLANIKAANEERFLLRLHPGEYPAYARRTGRFLPRWAGIR